MTTSTIAHDQISSHEEDVSTSMPVSSLVILQEAIGGEGSKKLAQCHDNYLFMGIAFVLLCIMAAAQVFLNSYDNDVWFFLATGREIVENGILYTNPFVIQENMGIVVQQWLSCVWVYVLYSAGGFVLIGIWTIILFAALMISMYALLKLVRARSGGGGWVMLVMVVAVYGMSTYMSVRPHLYSMLAFVWVVYFLEKYRASKNARWLVPLPFIVLLHVNLHAAIAPFDLVIIICYAIPNFLAPIHSRGHLSNVHFANASYGRAAILVALASCAVALLVNPYFIDGALYVFKSYGSASYEGYIAEMGYFVPAKSIRFICVLSIVLGACICIGRRGLKCINLPLVLLAIGTACMAFTHVRNIWLCALFGCIFIVWATSDVSIGWPAKLSSKRISFTVPAAIGVVAALVIGGFQVPTLLEFPKNDSFTPVAAMDYLDETIEDKEGIKVFTFFNSGGYIEWRGYKVNIDPRPELFAPSITGLDFDYYVEYVDMSVGNTVFNDYINKYDFDVFVIPTEDSAAELLRSDWDYVSIPSGEGYVAFAKRSLVSHDASEEIELN